VAQSKKKLHERLAQGSDRLPTTAPKLKKGELLPGGIKPLEMLIEEGYDPVHAVYVFLQNNTSYFAEGVSQLPEMRKFAEIVRKAEDEYLPSGPPMSPLTPSYFTSWAFYDLQFDGTDTLAQCHIEANDVFRFNADQLDALKKLSDSRMGIFEHVGMEGDFVRLRELITEDEFVCLSTSGYKGQTGELWYVRRLPPLFPEYAGYHILFITPYVLVQTTKDDWTQYLRRILLKVKGADDREKLHRLLKYGLSRHHWNEFIFKAYHGHQRDAVFLAGIPDLKSTLPHG
jgi:hypothetical protein